MSAKSEPPAGPVSILPPTEAIDEDWGETPPPVAPVLPAKPAPVEARPVAAVKPPSPAASAPVTSAPKSDSVGAATRSVTTKPAPAPTPKVEPKRSGVGMYVAAGALVAAVGIWFTIRSPEPERPSTPVAVESPPVASANPVPAAPVPAPAASDLPSASATGVPTEPTASAAPSAAPAVVPSTDTSAGSEAGETIAVRINITPEGSKLTLKGEEVGKTPMVLELPRGERRVYEVVSKGYYPRRLVIDGTKSEIAYGLKPIEQP